jgi:PKD repeat protein
VNFVAFDATPSSDFSSNTLGITYSVYTFGNPSYFLDSDIIFNDRDFSWGPGGRGNVKSVSLHEIGHFVGLGHTTNSQTVMYPYDQGFLQLSADEITAAQTLYPGAKSGTPPPPPPPPSGSVIAVGAASPASGPAPLNVGFDASASVGSNTTISSYEWNFGDGQTATGVTTGHVYNTPGIYTATLTVSDDSGHTNSETISINVASGNGSDAGGGTGGGTSTTAGTPIRGCFKVVFITAGRDSFNVTLLSQNVVRYNPLSTTGDATPVQGTVTVAGRSFPFSYDPLRRKAYGLNGLKIAVSQRTGTVSISLRNVDLQAPLGALGAENMDVFGAVVSVPVSVVFGDGSQLGLSSDIPFYYFGRANKVGAGKY